MRKIVIAVILATMLFVSDASAFSVAYDFFMNDWQGGGGPPAGQSVLQGGGLGDQNTPMGGMWHCWTPEWAEFMRGER